MAKTTEVSGRVTAESIKHGSWPKKQTSLWRLTIFGYAVSVGVLASLAPTPAQASALEAAVATLQSQVTTLQGQISSLQTSNSSLQSEVTALQNQLIAAQPVLALAPYVSVTTDLQNGVVGPNIIFTGANIHIHSGSGSTNDGGMLVGRGNLIIGYDELPLLHPPNRGGSHNLVIGLGNNFTSSAFGGLVAGEQNTVSAEGASVTGGYINTASGIVASITGGSINTASGQAASVTGGDHNTASGLHASVTSGDHNTASGTVASVSGGESNIASGAQSVVIGGMNNTASTPVSIAPHPPFPLILSSIG